MFSLMLTLLLTSQPAEFNIPTPEFGKATDWLNSKPLKMADLKGKVVIVHFFAFNCINCRRNYPWYKEVQTKYQAADVVMIGIHTPELQGEYDVAALKKKLADAGLTHPRPGR
ncbi:MAG: redoxin domain-containing protein [Gemmatales bacterium]